IAANCIQQEKKLTKSETHSEKRKFGKPVESSANKKARREVSKKYGKFTEGCIPDGVFPIGDDVFVFASIFYDSISVHIRHFKKHNRKQVSKNLYGDLRNEKPKAPRFKIGDVVRINKQNLHFEKGYEQNWRRGLFTVYEIVQRIPIVYRLKDLQGEEIKDTYYEAELQKFVDSGFYPVENVIKQRKRRGITEYFVKFLGYPEKFNDWVTDIQKV
ncbi:chromo domain-containing protein, partial [Trichonephila inaurata madagascariensis]